MCDKQQMLIYLGDSTAVFALVDMLAPLALEFSLDSSTSFVSSCIFTRFMSFLSSVLLFLIVNVLTFHENKLKFLF